MSFEATKTTSETSAETTEQRPASGQLDPVSDEAIVDTRAADVIAAFRASFDARLDWQPVSYGGAATPSRVLGSGTSSQLARAERKSRLGLVNRLASIDADAAAVETLYRRGVWEAAPTAVSLGAAARSSGGAPLQRWPLVGNRRCGLWYVPTHSRLEQTRGLTFERVVHFKSVDGHAGSQRFGARFLNLPALILSVAHGGLVVVDATRSGKLVPDALHFTLPIWCAVMNALWWWQTTNEALDTCPGGDVVAEAAFWLRLCCSWDVEASAHAQMADAAARGIRMLRACGPFIRWFRQQIDETGDCCVFWPCSVCRCDRDLMERIQGNASCRIKIQERSMDDDSWVTFGSAADDASSVLQKCAERLHHRHGNRASLRVVPIVGVSASDVRQEGHSMAGGRYRYIAGAGDDEESWSHGLDPAVWWHYHASIGETLAQHSKVAMLVRQWLATDDRRRQHSRFQRYPQILASIWSSAGAQLFIGCCSVCATGAAAVCEDLLGYERSEDASSVFWLDAHDRWHATSSRRVTKTSPQHRTLTTTIDAYETLPCNTSTGLVSLYASSPRRFDDSASTPNQSGCAADSPAPHDGDQLSACAGDAPIVEHSDEASIQSGEMSGEEASDEVTACCGRRSNERDQQACLSRQRKWWTINSLETLWPRLVCLLQQERRSVVLATVDGDGLALAAALVWLATDGMQRPETALTCLEQSLIALQCRYPAADLSRATLKRVRSLLQRWASQGCRNSIPDTYHA
ncbi:hypothetical protein CCYA_CCYA04G1284 [Cyanidiococcus yangmingshanensis]|nr:hypothetical protein CCYA_CCYA04G1284 [Cyanidiococcus yangmingshanensis]